MAHDDIGKEGDSSLSKKLAYQNLLNELKGMIEKARSKDAGVQCRQDLLTCQGCGAYEDRIPRKGREVFTRENDRTGEMSFIMIDFATEYVQTGSYKCSLTAYDSICPVCGLRQTMIRKKD